MRYPSYLALLLLPVGSIAAQQPERYLMDGDHLAIYNLAGLLQVEPGQGQVAVVVTRGGADASRLTVAQGEIDDQQTLRLIYPADKIRYSLGKGEGRTDLRVREDGTFGDSDWDWDRDGDHHDDHHHRNRSHEGHRVVVATDSDGLDAHADLTVTVPANAKVSFYLAVGRVTVTNVGGEMRIDAHSAPVSVSGFKGSLSVDVGSGSVHATQVDGELDVDTGSGSVEVTQVRGRSLMIDTGSGDVTGSDLQGDDVSVDTGSGSIALSAIRYPQASLETGSGNVRADFQGDVGALSVETGSGDVSIKAPPTLGAEVEIETASGDIETDFPVQITRHARDHMSGRIGDGKGSIAIETGSGGVRLLKNPN